MTNAKEEAEMDIYVGTVNLAITGTVTTGKLIIFLDGEKQGTVTAKANVDFQTPVNQSGTHTLKLAFYGNGNSYNYSIEIEVLLSTLVSSKKMPFSKINEFPGNNHNEVFEYSFQIS